MKFRDESDYIKIKDQMENMQPITFGSSINVLLISDRLYGCAKGLQEYLGNSVDISVDLVFDDLEEANKIIQDKPIDFLIIVGYLQGKHNYEVIQPFKQINKYSSFALYAHLDMYIRDECLEQGITYVFDRTDPIAGLISHMREIHDVETQRMRKEVSPSATREQLRLATMRKVGLVHS